jgi:hypothetical protein
MHLNPGYPDFSKLQFAEFNFVDDNFYFERKISQRNKKMEMKLISTSKNGEDPFLIHKEGEISENLMTVSSDISLVQQFEKMVLETEPFENGDEQLTRKGNFDPS